MAAISHKPSTGITELRQQLKRFLVDDPEVSIVVPAYNEEKTIERLLKSMAAQVTSYRVELIIANNNSTDRTQALLDQYGVRSLFVQQQGVAYARQAGLEAARGIYIANADADSVYPPTWLNTIIKPLENPAVSCTYGTYSFIPSARTSPLQLALYERASRLASLMRSRTSEPTNVLGFNFAFRRADALAVGGFNLNAGHTGTVNHKSGPCEDGWMALCLMERGRLYRVSSPKARARTSDRRLLESGGLGQAFTMRLRREWKRLMA
ncbi:glycosyltransferase family 2 protein [Spirosoma sordidisoli]|uniref:Glycosyltransferase family 2 protein n=1 Tax=Spirosoma sordidisoli TaxID=2502893 RepID=A0A4Q2UWA0_9BACT|nr:glycosyltransferase family 2 protein [Spirosoma sordidisoli]RYC72125.1 glycosyltransferase family 2 protein [Spirosoma sordidisoli]